jgi:hypothetical protein
MEKKATAKVDLVKLKKIMSQLAAGVFPKSRLTKVRCELTVFSDRIELNAPWGKYALEASANGTAKATFSLETISKILKTFTESEITINVTEGQIKINGFSFNTDTFFFENDSILRSIVLPVNSTDLDLVRLLNGKYTYQELQFNKLWAPAVSAENRLKSALKSALKYLKPFGISEDDLQKIVNEKLAIQS